MVDEPSGQELKDQFEEETTATVNRGNIYPNLNTLTERGFINKESRDCRTNCYSLTQQGRSCLHQRHKWEQEHLAGAQQTV
ncbi:PadR family transcriptional regulator [Natronoarchaeum mannanilyticum]